MTAYYNEIDPYAAQWLRNLIADGAIAAGDVDERSVADVHPGDLDGYSQCHFFAGVGGWSFALRLAGWEDDRPVWTGSCPCQDFSLVGKRAGFNGDRDLWPEWFRLIEKRRPDCLFGEQVDDAPEWIDRTAADLEGIGYTCGAVVIPAVAVRAPHERARLYFGSHPDAPRRPDIGGLTTAEARSNIRPAAGLVYRDQTRHFQGSFEPDKSWVVDGLSGEGRAVGAFGNAIVPQIAAEFIMAYAETF